MIKRPPATSRPGELGALLRVAAILAVIVTACGNESAEDFYARGRRLKVAGVPTATEAEVVDAAIHAAFDVEPALNLRMHVRRLPRTAGDSGGEPIPPALVRALRDRGLVVGTCEPVRVNVKGTPHCDVPEAGYIVRASDVFRVSPDTLEIYFAAEKYGASTGQRPERLHFEKIYRLVKEGSSWRVAREARAP